MFRRAVLEVSLEALKYNFNLAKSFLLKNQKMITVIKANAYGLGAVEVAQLFKSLGADFFAVASVSEAIELLEEAEVNCPVLVLSPPLEEEIETFVNYQLRVAVSDLKRAKLLSLEASKQNKVIKVHVKVDTGMGRLGVPFFKAVDFIKELSKLENLEIEGIFSHFPSADLLDEFTFEQISRFKAICLELEKDAIQIPLKHISNSAGLTEFNKDPFFTAVRPGIMLYGAPPSSVIAKNLKAQQVITFKAPIIELKELKKGDTVSYGRTFKAKKDMKVAVVSAGYADGYSTLNSSKAVLYLKDKPHKILGRVCMDYLMIDISGTEASLGDEVLLYGDKDGIRAEDIAKQTGLIAYEVLTNVSQRVPRKYV